jgi:HlyD family secretion protein
MDLRLSGTYSPVLNWVLPDLLARPPPSKTSASSALNGLRISGQQGSDNAIDPGSGRSMHETHAMSQQQPRLDDLRIDRPTETTSRPRLVTWLVMFVLLTIAAFAVWWFMRPRLIEVRTVTAREVSGSAGDRTVLNASGYITARREATVSSKVMGKVIEVAVEEGNAVKEGQLLARLDDTNAQASLRLARAQLAAAQAALEESRVRLKEAGRDFRRQESLKKSNVVAQSDYDRAEAAESAWRARLAQQESELIVAERNIAVWQQQVDDTIIRAPFTGIVTSKNAQPGEMISPMSSGGFTRTGICTIVDMESLEIEIDVNESYINRVTAGQPVEATLDAYADWKIPCKVIAIIPTADRQKSTVKVRVGFDKLDPRILPQMAVKVAFREIVGPAAKAASAPGGVVLPKSAVRNADGRDVVFVVRGGRVERRAITVSSAQNNDVTVGAGVTAGEKIVVDAPTGLADGVAVAEKKL